MTRIWKREREREGGVPKVSDLWEVEDRNRLSQVSAVRMKPAQSGAWTGFVWRRELTWEGFALPHMTTINQWAEQRNWFKAFLLTDIISRLDLKRPPPRLQGGVRFLKHASCCKTVLQREKNRKKEQRRRWLQVSIDPSWTRVVVDYTGLILTASFLIDAELHPIHCHTSRGSLLCAAAGLTQAKCAGGRKTNINLHVSHGAVPLSGEVSELEALNGKWSDLLKLHNTQTQWVHPWVFSPALPSHLSISFSCVSILTPYQ